MIVYIAGKMAGLSDNGRAAFAKAEKELREFGYRVLNPACLPDDLYQWSYMPICLAMIDQSDVVVMLPGWESSKGANIEKEYAKYNGKMVYCIDEFIKECRLLMEHNGEKDGTEEE